MPLIQYDHISLQDRWPETEVDVSEVPRVGETVAVFEQSWVVWNVHWWDSPEPGHPVARVSLRPAGEVEGRSRRYGWRVRLEPDRGERR